MIAVLFVCFCFSQTGFLNYGALLASNSRDFEFASVSPRLALTMCTSDL